MSHSRTEADQERDDGAIKALIDAEREWRDRLDATRADAAQQIAKARDAAELEIAAAKAELGPEVERQRRVMEEELSNELERIAHDAQREAARFTDIDNALVRRLAAEIAQRSVWLAPESGK